MFNVFAFKVFKIQPHTIQFFKFSRKLHLSTLQAEVSVSLAPSMALSIYEVIHIAVSCVVGLFTPPRETQTNYVTDSDANNFVNAKSHSKTKPLLTGYVARSP